MTKYFKYLFIILFITIGCKKRLIDYRNKYCGIWKFDYQYQYSGQGVYQPIQEGSIECKIYYLRKESQEVVYFKFLELDTTYTVERNGKISGCGSDGKFDSRNKMHLTYFSSSCTGGLGGSHAYTITATKK